MPNNSYEKQKKYFEYRKQLRVWVETEKYEAFTNAVKNSGESVYSVIHQFIDEYIQNHGEDKIVDE